MPDDLREIIDACRLQSGCSGLPELRIYIRKHPDTALLDSVDCLSTMAESDSGEVRCLVLQELRNAGQTRTSIEHAVEAVWGRLLEPSRLGFAASFGDAELFSVNCVVRLFNRTENSTRVRHRIAAVVASNRMVEAADRLPDMIRRIGAYDEEAPQQVLESFCAKVKEALDTGKRSSL